MKTLTGAERIIKTLQLQEPDRVPHFEDELDPHVSQKILPGSSYCDIAEHFDWDMVTVDDRVLPGYRVEILDSSGKYFRNQWGTIVCVTETMPQPVEPVIKSEENLDTWIPPDPDESWRYERLVELVKRYKGQRAIGVSFADPFTVANEMRGAADHFMDFIRNPELVDRLARLIRDYYLRYIKNCIEVSAEIVYVTGDYADTKGPMVSPEHIAKHVTPVLKALADATKRQGAYVLKHTDGNICE